MSLVRKYTTFNLFCSYLMYVSVLDFFLKISTLFYEEVSINKMEVFCVQKKKKKQNGSIHLSNFLRASPSILCILL